MGEELSKHEFHDSEVREFQSRVLSETQLLNQWFKDNLFAKEENHYGLELEGVLLNKDYLPSPQNTEFLKVANNPGLVPEIAKFNFEINSDVHTENPNLLSQMHKELLNWKNQARTAAEKLKLNASWIGVLPTLREEDLNIENLTPSNRYYALAKRLVTLRNSAALVNISRFDDLQFEHPDIMLESAATSVQFHTQVHPNKALAAYFAAQWVSGPMVAISANSPFLFGKKLWDESRIAIFEQAVALSQYSNQSMKDPVTYGSKWPADSLHDIFVSNLSYPVLLPMLFESSPEELRHLKILNGQIWRWNRVIIGTGITPHIRIEHRPLPAGPTAVDTVANFALYLGLMKYYTREVEKLGVNQYDFQTAKENFYKCAKFGLKADVTWQGKSVNVQTLLHDTLIPLARTELIERLGFDPAEVDHYINQVLLRRAQNGWTGAAWQKSFIDLKGRDFQGLMKAYIENQLLDLPVCQWKI